MTREAEDDDDQELIKLYIERKRHRLCILATHDPLPNLSSEACAQRAPLWLRLDDLNARIREYKGGVR